MENKTQNRGQDDRSDNQNQKRDQQDQQKIRQGQQKQKGEAGQDQNLNPRGDRKIRQTPASPNGNQEEREDTRLNQSGRARTQHEDNQQPRSRRLNLDQENEDAEDTTAEQGSAEAGEKKTSEAGQKSGY